VGFGVVGFEIYAYYLLFRQFGQGDPLIWISLVLSMFFVFAALAIFRGFMRRAGPTFGKLMVGQGE
jgi:hypothetical protein